MSVIAAKTRLKQGEHLLVAVRVAEPGWADAEDEAELLFRPIDAVAPTQMLRPSQEWSETGWLLFASSTRKFSSGAYQMSLRKAQSSIELSDIITVLNGRSFLALAEREGEETFLPAPPASPSEGPVADAPVSEHTSSGAELTRLALPLVAAAIDGAGWVPTQLVGVTGSSDGSRTPTAAETLWLVEGIARELGNGAVAGIQTLSWNLAISRRRFSVSCRAALTRPLTEDIRAAFAESEGDLALLNVGEDFDGFQASVRSEEQSLSISVVCGKRPDVPSQSIPIQR